MNNVSTTSLCVKFIVNRHDEVLKNGRICSTETVTTRFPRTLNKILRFPEQARELLKPRLAIMATFIQTAPSQSFHSTLLHQPTNRDEIINFPSSMLQSSQNLWTQFAERYIVERPRGRTIGVNCLKEVT